MESQIWTRCHNLQPQPAHPAHRSSPPVWLNKQASIACTVKYSTLALTATYIKHTGRLIRYTFSCSSQWKHDAGRRSQTFRQPIDVGAHQKMPKKHLVRIVSGCFQSFVFKKTSFHTLTHTDTRVSGNIGGRGKYRKQPPPKSPP